MNRRSFFTKALGTPDTQSAPSEPFLKAYAPRPLNVTAGLEPYTKPLDKKTALHLLRRTGFQPAQTDIPYLVGQTAQTIVSLFLFEGKSESEIVNPSTDLLTWIKETPRGGLTPEEQQLYRQRIGELQAWWYAAMWLSPIPYTLREKMTFFWHNHFTTDKDKVKVPQFLFWQNDKFRRNPLDGKKADDPLQPAPTTAFGNIKELTRAMVSDPAMLIFLDNAANQKGKPNENFARELMELFTLGIGNYTEQDIIEVARTLTGWTIPYNRTTKEYTLSSKFMPLLFDSGAKTIFKKTDNFTTDTLIDHIFQQDACAKFFARKIYKFFVYEIPDEAIVTQLADLLKANNYELKPVLKTLLTSAHFFDEQFYGAQIKSPLDFMIGIIRLFNIKNMPAVNALQTMAALTLEPLNPPTVEGWKGYHTWINTTTYPLRKRAAENLVDGKDYNGKKIPVTVDVVTFAKNFSSKDDAVQLVSDIADFLLPVEVSAKQKEFLVSELLQGSPAYDWDINNAVADSHLRLLLKAIMRLPEFQLM